MAVEYNKTFLNIRQRPSSKYMMVSIPMYMYRVETNEFSHGLNFFQKTVLKFKAKPGIKDETIANFLGLDSKLIAIVTAELQAKQLINEHGSIGDKGKEKLKEVDGLVVNSGKRRIGYVLKYVDQDKLYQYYVNSVIPADLLDYAKGQHPKVVTGTKGDGEDYTEVPFYLDEILKSTINSNNPTEREVLLLIQNSNKKGLRAVEGDAQNEKLSKQLSIRFVNDQPELVWVITYVYLHQNEDGLYEPDWRVLDPFGNGDNVALKFYLNAPGNKSLLESIKKRFADAKTLGGKILSDYQEQLNKLIEDRLLTDFSFGFNQLDGNLQQYLEVIVKNLILLENHNFTDLDASVSFSLNLQNALENILKQDKEQRMPFYESVYAHLADDSLKKRNGLIGIYRQRLFSNDTQVPQPLLNASKGNLARGNSLLSYLVSFILTYAYDNKSALFKLLQNKIEMFIAIAQLRNEKGHGQTSTENSLKPLAKEDVEKYYFFIKSLINEYIQNH